MLWHKSKEIEDLRKKIESLTSHQNEVQKARQLLDELTQELAGKNRKLEEQAERLTKTDQLKTDFISSAKHELRTPLAVLKECVSAILEGSTGEISQDTQDYLTIALNNVERLINLTNQLTDISKLELGRVHLQRKKEEVMDLVTDAIQSMKALFEKKGIKIELPDVTDISPVLCDSHRIIQVLVNLMGNALKHIEPGKGLIQLFVKSRSDVVEIHVKDNGIGIPKERIPDLFNKFVQIQRAASPDSTGRMGMGLGLSICKAIIEQHHGRIWAQSEVGVGSTFSFTLPVYTPDHEFRDTFEDVLYQATASDSPLGLVAMNVANMGALEGILPEHEKNKFLSSFEETIKTKLRSNDLLLRYHSSKIFVVLAKTDKIGALVMEGRLREALQKKFSNLPLELQSSIAIYPEEGKNQTELIRVAENRLKK